MSRYPVNEIFYSLQGEGHYTGTPAVFIRLQGCDVGCPWCDTKHTWTLEQSENVDDPNAIIMKTHDSPAWAYFTPADIGARIARMIYPERRAHVVITGGEPFMHHLTDLCDYLLECDLPVQIETSGTHGIPDSLPTAVWLTLSPKLNMPGGRQLREEAVLRADEVKWPVGKQSDVDAAIAFVERYRVQLGKDSSWSPDIYLQPLSQSPAATDLCIKAAKQRMGWKVSLQAHKFVGIR